MKKVDAKMQIYATFFFLFAFVCASCSDNKPAKPKPEIKQKESPLQLSAARALNDRTGVILIIDPKTGKLLASVYNGIATDVKFAPGSVIKPFTALAAIRGGKKGDISHQCRVRYTNGDFEQLCSHKKISAPFNLEQAIAYSCNDYFGTLGEKLNKDSFDVVLKEYGIDAGDGEYNVKDALGLSPRVAVTPQQLLNSYVSLLSDKDGAKILKGMRGSIEYGTASDSGLKDFKQFIFGKTGTSTDSAGRYNQGWFIGFANKDKSVDKLQAQAIPDLGVLVFLKDSNGAESSRTAASIFYDWGNFVRVRSVKEGVNHDMPMEDYVAGVVTGEAGHMKHIEALKAQAVAARTFAMKNRDRHSDVGYDFCSTTHCQRYVNGTIPAIVREAVNSTHGEILRDYKNNVADIYYHAMCGGITADKTSLWGGEPSNSLSSVSDEFCSISANNSWSQTIPQTKLLEALRSDPGTNPGATLRSVRIDRRDSTGRAEIIRIDGAHSHRLRGWDFTLIVNRHLGWNTLKSSRFEISLSNNAYIFRGSGHGHGLGFCQEGGEQAARRGMTYKSILKHYFPKLKSLSGDKPNNDVLTQNYQRMVIENFRINYSRENNKQDLDESLKILVSTRKDIVSRLKAANIQLSESDPFEIVIHGSTADFIAITGQSGLVAGVTSGRIINLQSLSLLKKRGILTSTLKHEFAHSVIEILGKRQAPRWLSEGMAIHIANEGGAYSRIQITQNLSHDKLNSRLARPVSVDEARELYAASYKEVKSLIDSKGEGHVWKMIYR